MGTSHTVSIHSLSKGLMGAGLAVALVASAAIPAHAQAAKLDDPTIVAIFDAANTWDIESGNLAARSGHDKAVREFGRMIAHDHTVVRQQGRDLATKLHVTPTPPKDFAMATDHATAMKNLHGLKGEAFDKAFLQHEVDYHKAVIDAINSTLLPATQNAEVKALEVKVAPAFQAHMMRAQQLLDTEAKEKK